MPLARGRAGRHHLIGSPYDHGEPITRMSIIPMVSVFALINIVILASIPAPVHVLTIDLPMPEFGGGPPDLISDPIGNSVRMDADGTIRWNGAAVSRMQLADLAQAILREEVEPYLVFTPDADAAYGDVLPVLNILRMSGIQLFCFGDLAEHWSLGRAAALPTLASAGHIRLKTMTISLPPEQAICDQLSGINEPPPPPT